MTEPAEFLEWLRPGGPWVLTAINPESKEKPVTMTLGPGDVEPFVTRYDGRWNIYYQVNPTLRAMTKKPGKADMAHMEFLHLDIDPRAGEDLEAEQERIRNLLGGAEPSAVVFSGGGYQALWRLDAPIAVDGDVALAEDAERYNRQLELQFGADACHNIDRLLRLPGTVNVLDAKKRAKGRKEGVRAEALSLTDAVFELAAFTQAPVSKPAKLSEPQTVGSIEELDELDRWNVPTRIRVIIAQGMHPDEPTKPSRSEWLFDAVCGLVRAGVPDPVILSIQMDPGWPISESVLEQGRKAKWYATRQITRAREIVELDEVGLQKTEKGVTLKNTHNIRVGLRQLGCKLTHDVFRDRMLIDGRFLSDAEGVRLRFEMEQRFDFLSGKDLFLDVLADEARKNAFHPVEEYLDELVWDRVGRLDRWIIEYGGAQDTAYVRAVGAIALIAAVRRIRTPGVKFDEMLVLEGPQGTNKSSALAALAGNDDWFSDDLPLDATSEKVIEALAGKWIVEAGEMAGMRKSDVESLKAFLSRQTDRGRLAYARLPVEVARQCIFIGTTNSDRYLRDSTGNRRFWPVLTDRFDVARLRADRDQLWAEAAEREAAGDSIRLDAGLWAEAATEQEGRRMEDPIAEILLSVFGELEVGKVRKTDVWEVLELRTEAKTPEMSQRVNTAMRELGWRVTKARFGRGTVVAFVKGAASSKPVSVWRDGGAWRADYERADPF